MKKCILIIAFFCLNSFIYAEDFLFKNDIPQVVTGTSFTQDVLSEYNPNIEVYTAKDIKNFGVENLTDLFSFIPGVNTFKTGSSNSYLVFRGFGGVEFFSPKVLIDGRETEDSFITGNYLYTLPLVIDDIDKIEVIKGNSFFSNEYTSPTGLINIVTKSPDLLGNNFINFSKGSFGLEKATFSFNKYLLNSYVKLTGKIRGTNEYNRHKRSNKFKFVNLTISRYIGENSYLYIKSHILGGDGHFKDRFVYDFFGKPNIVKYNIKSKNLIGKNFYISYRYPNFDASFLYSKISSNVDTYIDKTPVSSSGTTSEFYKFDIRKKFVLFNSSKLTLGAVNRIYNLHLKSINTAKTNQFTIYLNGVFPLSRCLTVKTSLKNDRLTNNGNKFSYFISGNFHSKDKAFGIIADYSKSIKYNKNMYKYFHINFKLTPGFFFNLPVKSFDIYPNKHLSPIEFYSTNLTFYYSKNKLNFKTKFFYNRSENTVTLTGKLKFFSSLSFYPINKYNLVVHGFETDVKYKLSKNIELFSSYYLQHFKNKTLNIQKDFIVPRYKILGGILFNNDLYSSSLTCYYIPQVNELEGNSDDYAELDFHLMRKFFKNKMEIGVTVKNLLNNVHKETADGLKIKREYFLKLKYNF